ACFILRRSILIFFVLRLIDFLFSTFLILLSPSHLSSCFHPPATLQASALPLLHSRLPHSPFAYASSLRARGTNQLSNFITFQLYNYSIRNQPSEFRNPNYISLHQRTVMQPTFCFFFSSPTPFSAFAGLGAWTTTHRIETKLYQRMLG